MGKSTESIMALAREAGKVFGIVSKGYYRRAGVHPSHCFFTWLCKTLDLFCCYGGRHNNRET